MRCVGFVMAWWQYDVCPNWGIGRLHAASLAWMYKESHYKTMPIVPVKPQCRVSSTRAVKDETGTRARVLNSGSAYQTVPELIPGGKLPKFTSRDHMLTSWHSHSQARRHRDHGIRLSLSPESKRAARRTVSVRSFVPSVLSHS